MKTLYEALQELTKATDEFRKTQARILHATKDISVYLDDLLGITEGTKYNKNVQGKIMNRAWGGRPIPPSHRTHILKEADIIRHK